MITDEPCSEHTLLEDQNPAGALDIQILLLSSLEV